MCLCDESNECYEDTVLLTSVSMMITLSKSVSGEKVIFGLIIKQPVGNLDVCKY